MIRCNFGGYSETPISKKKIDSNKLNQIEFKIEEISKLFKSFESELSSKYSDEIDSYTQMIHHGISKIKYGIDEIKSKKEENL
jgi:hypothetical protein